MRNSAATDTQPTAAATRSNPPPTPTTPDPGRTSPTPTAAPDSPDTVAHADLGRIERALDRSGSILLDEAKVVVYVLIVGAPLFALLALGLGSLRVRRRRTETRLLSTS